MPKHSSRNTAEQGIEPGLRELWKNPPATEAELHTWVRRKLGIEVPREPVCRGHQAPWQFFADAFLERPAAALVLGPRGGGKSFLSALESHLTSGLHPGLETRVLGGSLAQSQQVHRALAALARGDDSVRKITDTRVAYENDSEVRVLPASSTSVRGPHVPSLKLDEIDELDEDCREAALGMCMNRNGMPASVLMTSTWHRHDGPMSQMIELAKAGKFPLYTFCIFEVLETCPDERSGPNLEKCPECPIQQWCHEDRDLDPEGRPKAKRSRGHYAIDALIQKARVVSSRVFESDYLCRGPKSQGAWFSDFNPVMNVTEQAEYDPFWPVHLAIDSGVYTGAVLFQIIPRSTRRGVVDEVRVFGEYLKEGKPAFECAQEILALVRERSQGRIDHASTDPSGGARNPVGPTVLKEYERAGLGRLTHWPKSGSVSDGLQLVESFLMPAEGETRLLIHPRCDQLITAFQSYRRAKRAGQWTDAPEDPQHPHEDLIDALRGGLTVRYPEGRGPQSTLPRASARNVF